VAFPQPTGSNRRFGPAILIRRAPLAINSVFAGCPSTGGLAILADNERQDPQIPDRTWVFWASIGSDSGRKAGVVEG
jgi:hypothetical protein